MKGLFFALVFILTSTTVQCQDQENSMCDLCNHPYFPGGIKALQLYIQNQLDYPASAIRDSIEGKVWLRFIVSKTGEISNCTIVQSLRSDCDSAAIELLKVMPPWKFDCAKPHAAYVNLPIVFRLRESIYLRKDEE